MKEYNAIEILVPDEWENIFREVKIKHIQLNPGLKIRKLYIDEKEVL